MTEHVRPRGLPWWSWLVAVAACPFGLLVGSSFIAFPVTMSWLMLAGRNPAEALEAYTLVAAGQDGWFAYSLSTSGGGTFCPALTLVAVGLVRGAGFRGRYVAGAAMLSILLACCGSMRSFFGQADPVESFSDSLAGVSLGDKVPAETQSDADGKYFVTTLEDAVGRVYLTECRSKIQDIRFMATYSTAVAPGFAEVSVVSSPEQESERLFSRFSDALGRDGWERLDARSGRDETGDFAEFYKKRRKRGVSRTCQPAGRQTVCLVMMTTINRVECR